MFERLVQWTEIGVKIIVYLGGVQTHNFAGWSDLAEFETKKFFGLHGCHYVNWVSGWSPAPQGVQLSPDFCSDFRSEQKEKTISALGLVFRSRRWRPHAGSLGCLGPLPGALTTLKEKALLLLRQKMMVATASELHDNKEKILIGFYSKSFTVIWAWDSTLLFRPIWRVMIEEAKKLASQKENWLKIINRKPFVSYNGDLVSMIKKWVGNNGHFCTAKGISKSVWNLGSFREWVGNGKLCTSNRLHSLSNLTI